MDNKRSNPVYVFMAVTILFQAIRANNSDD